LRIGAANGHEEPRRKTFNRRSTQIYADEELGIAAKSRLRPIFPFSYVGHGHKRRKKNREWTLLRKAFGAAGYE